MNKIPTAEELALQMQHDLGYEDLTDPVKFAYLVAIEYAKLHVQAALKAAAKTHLPPQYYGETDSKPRTSQDKEVILNSYPSSLIQ